MVKKLGKYWPKKAVELFGADKNFKPFESYRTEFFLSEQPKAIKPLVQIGGSISDWQALEKWKGICETQSG